MTTANQALLSSLKTAPLLAKDLPQAQSFDRTLLSAPNKNAALNFDQKLGHLYEDALQHLIEQSNDLTLIDRSIQIFSAHNQTLGELDFLLQTPTGPIHLELAVKFYLAEQKPDGSWHYPGPNRRDNWHRKLNHMQTRQLTLSQTPEAKALLQKNYNITDIQTKQLIYGCLFTPITQPDAPIPEVISSTARMGQWLRVDDLPHHFSNQQTFLLIPKPLWPINLSERTLHLLKPVTAIDLQHQAQDRCVMFTQSDKIKPHFLVPNDWK